MSSFIRSWYTSWLPTLPSLNFTLPSSLQGKFVSFLLKKSLGNFLRHGQLDSRQIDSQIGSGFVQINDLEFDNEVINALLSDLPVVLHDGHISSLTARVPWPNPLTSTVGFSVNSLHLTLHLLPSSAHEPSRHPSLAQSVASVADSFLHEELAPQDQATLWDSFQSDVDSETYSRSDQAVPGGLVADPFLTNPEEISQLDTDPVGVSIFAILIERLLARFQFDATNTKLTLVHPRNMSVTLSVDSIRYYTDERGASAPASSDSGSAISPQRTLSITGMKLQTRNLRVGAAQLVARTPTVQSPVSSPRHPPCAVSPHSPQSPSSSSSSSLDEEAQFTMSQSLAFLPPREDSPTSTVSGSLYQSAVSTAGGEEHLHSQPRSSPDSFPRSEIPKDPNNPGEERLELLMSFGESPIMIQVNSLPTSTAASQHETPSTSQGNGRGEKLHFSLSIGLIACALRPWHVSGLSNLVGSLSTKPRKDNDPRSAPPSESGMDIEADVKLRGLIVIVPLIPSGHQENFMTHFFESPLVPHSLPSDYLRLYIETVLMSFSHVSVEDVSTRNPTEAMKPTMVKKLLGSSITLDDMSLFFVHGALTTALPRKQPSASPIIITDHGLVSQYPRNHHHPSRNHPDLSLPAFEIIDWTSEKSRANGLKLSLWRTKHKSHAQEGHNLDSKPSPSAVSINFKEKQEKQTPSRHKNRPTVHEVRIAVMPLHVFVDLEIALRRDGLLAFLEEAFEDGTKPWSPPEEHTPWSYDSETETPSASPRTLAADQRAKERQRLEKLVIEDLDLDLDYGTEMKSKGTGALTKLERSRQNPVDPGSKPDVSAQFAMIRVQVRCPSSFRRQRPQRSGALVVDLHAVRFVNTRPLTKMSTRFTMEQSEALEPKSEEFLLGVDCEKIVIACSQAHEFLARTVLSVGPILSNSGAHPDIAESSALPLLPRLAIAKSNLVEHIAVVSLSSDLPSLVIDISKSTFDCLQYWADDAAQNIQKFMNGIFDSDRADAERSDSRDTSIIGSRFFAKSKSGSTSAMSTSLRSPSSETAMKITISDAFVRTMVPRVKRQQRNEPFIAHASDLDISLQTGSGEKDETVLTLEVMDLMVDDFEQPQSVHTFISPTSPRGLANPSEPMMKLRFSSANIPGTLAKESKIKSTISGFTFTVFPDLTWISDLLAFVKPPPGAFESVIPSERTHVFFRIHDGAILMYAPSHPGAIVFQIEDLDFATDVVGESPDSSFRLSTPSLALLAVDDSSSRVSMDKLHSRHGVDLWTSGGFALIAEVADFTMTLTHSAEPPSTSMTMDRIRLRVHICADTLSAVTAFARDFSVVFSPREEGRREARVPNAPTVVSSEPTNRSGLMASVDDLAFKKVPEVGPAPDMISDDLPTNPDYLDESFGAAAGLRELREDDLDDFYDNDSQAQQTYTSTTAGTGLVSRFGGETVKILRQEGIQIKENYFNDLPPDTKGLTDSFGETTFRLRIRNGDVTLVLYDGFDWAKTRRTIEEEVREMRRRLAKIRQLVASGQVQEPSTEDTSALLFNSVYIGLGQDVDSLEPNAIIAAIDEELKDDIETSSQSSWQSLKPPITGKPQARSIRVRGKRLTRSRGPSMEFCFFGLEAEVDNYLPEAPLVSRLFTTVRDAEILDHIKTSTWKKFLTELRSDSRGNIRETDSNMLRLELFNVRPVPGHPIEEARLRAKILPLRLYVDQDAVDFLKSFFSFKDPYAQQGTESSDNEIYFQLAEVFPVDLKLDYKPRRVDYRALREGRTIELMNFFHFDGAEMTLRHITLAGITGWPRFFELLNDLWTPDVKATQLVDVISGVSPIRSVVNVGSGVADLVLLPIAQYKKDGRIVRGVQKGATAFVKSTAVEAIKLGARLATGTQVILEQAEGVLGGQFNRPITAESISGNMGDEFMHLATSDDEESAELISKYAQQPTNIQEGVQSAYQSLRKNLNSAAQTILAVPMEVYERAGNEGPVRSVIRAVPIAVLRPMIGASEAVSKTLLGLHNTLDPEVQHENEAKYKRP